MNKAIFGWNGSSYRFKLVSLALALALSGQLLVALITYLNVRDTSEDINADGNRNLYKQYANRITAYFKEINAISSYLRGSEITGFSRSYWKLREPRLAEAKLADIRLLIDHMKLGDMQVDAVYMLGNNFNQTGFAQPISSFLPAIDTIPSVDDFEKLGFLGTLLRVNGLPAYYKPGEWSDRIEDLPADKRDFAIRSGVRDFLLALEGRISVTSYAENVMLSVVLQTDTFDRLLSDVIASRGGGMLLDSEGRIVWSNPSRFSNPAFEPSEVDVHAAGEGVSSIGGQDIRYQTLTPYGFVWMQYDAVRIHREELRDLAERTSILLLAGMALSTAAALWLSGKICGPLGGLAQMLKRKGKSLPLRPIPDHLQNKAFWSRAPLRQKTFYHFLLSSIAPVLFFGILSSAQAGQLAKSILYDSMDNWTSRLVQDIRVRKTAYENLIRRLTADGAIASIAADQRVIGDIDRNALETMFVKQTEGIGDIAYFALRSPSGTPLYASIYPNNLELFYTDVNWESAYSGKSADIAWIEGKRDVFNQLSLTLAARLKANGNANGDGFSNSGYLQIALKLSSLHPGISQSQAKYAIIRDGGGLVAGSLSDDRYVEAAKRAISGGEAGAPSGNPIEATIDGSHYLLAVRSIPGTDWTVVSYQPTLEIHFTSKALLERNLGISMLASVAVFLLAIVVSRWLVRPIERLKQEMERVGQGSIDSRIATESKDEIGELIESFNIMIGQINDLINDNITRQVRERELDRLKTHAELGMLQQQINPHFLYNTLEAINMRALHLGATDVSRMVTALAKLFRYAISSATDKVELQQELEHTRNYVTIQEIRFRDRFKVNWNIDSRTTPIPVLKLLLQPIVENAINHGLAEYAANGLVEIESRLEGGFLLIDVTDNGIGIGADELEALRTSFGDPLTAPSPSSVRTDRTGVGLRNVFMRLKFHYGDEADMTIASEPMEGARVTLKIPV